MLKSLQALKNVFRAADEKAAKAMKDDVRDGKFAIEDSKKQIKEFQVKVAKLNASTKRRESELVEIQEQVRKWNSFAKKAADAQNEADCRQALEQKALAKSKAETIKNEIEKDQQVLAALRKQLNTAKAKVMKAENNHERLAAQNEGADIRLELARASSEFGDKGPLAALDDLEKSVAQKTSEAEAWEEIIVDENPVQNMEEKYGAGSSNVDDELAKLMNKK